MILIIDTTQEQKGKPVEAVLSVKLPAGAYEYVCTGEMNISHCLGCNFCWLKTPGKCCIKDDYEPLLRKMQQASQVWLVSDTAFGFVSYRTKNIIDRVMPIVTMNLHMSGKQMRHVMRYDHNPDFGIIYTGEGDREYLTRWCERVVVNFGTGSRGAFPADEYMEAVKCMQL